MKWKVKGQVYFYDINGVLLLFEAFGYLFELNYFFLENIRIESSILERNHILRSLADEKVETVFNQLL